MNGATEKVLSRLGIYRIELPNPFSTDTINCYFIEGSSPTLIDTAIATDEAYDSLSRALSRIGRSVRDIGRIILTHGHADHRALAPRIRDASAAEVFCHPLEADKVTHAPPERKALSRGKTADFFRSMGVPEVLLPTLVKGPQSPFVKPRLDCASFLRDGDQIRIDNLSLRTLHTPGHSCGSICLYDEQSGLLFTGDTLLPSSRVTPLLEIEMFDEDPDYNSLKLHVESLQRLLKLGASGVLPGHGEVLDECEGVVHALLERHRKRRRHILRSLRNGRRTLYEICRSVFLFISPGDLYLALSEVMGNLGILIEEGKVVRQQESGFVYYEKV